jgi:hypothetical protein
MNDNWTKYYKPNFGSYYISDSIGGNKINVLILVEENKITVESDYQGIYRKKEVRPFTPTDTNELHTVEGIRSYLFKNINMIKYYIDIELKVVLGSDSNKNFIELTFKNLNNDPEKMKLTSKPVNEKPSGFVPPSDVQTIPPPLFLNNQTPPIKTTPPHTEKKTKWVLIFWLISIILLIVLIFLAYVFRKAWLP